MMMLRTRLAVSGRFISRSMAATRMRPQRNMSMTTAKHDTVALENLYEFGAKHVNPGVSRLTQGIMVKGEGSYVYYDDGRKLLDFSCGIGVTNLGHAHPDVSGAAAAQCSKLVHSQCSIALHEPYLRLIERLLPVMPHPSLDSFFFWNSGSEAVEAAIKIARQVTGRNNIVSFQGAYHGRTYGAMAVTRSKNVYAVGQGPLMPSTFSVPYPHFHQLGLGPEEKTPGEIADMCLYQLDLLFAQQSAPRDTAAIIIEPVLGEGGYIPAPPEFLQGLRERCDEHGILLIVDEVQSGMGRAGGVPVARNGGGETHGKGFFAIEESGVRPDILLTAKGLGNGFPISGVVASSSLTSQIIPGSLGGTYAGNVVSCAAATAVVDTMHSENVIANVSARSNDLFSALNGLRYDPALNPHILDVRGKGLMIAVEFASPSSPGRTARSAASPRLNVGIDGTYSQVHTPKDVQLIPGLATKVTKKCAEKGLLLLTTSAYEVVRFIPPLNITKEELLEGTKIFGDALREVVKESAAAA